VKPSPTSSQPFPQKAGSGEPKCNPHGLCLDETCPPTHQKRAAKSVTESSDSPTETGQRFFSSNPKIRNEPRKRRIKEKRGHDRSSRGGVRGVDTW